VEDLQTAIRNAEGPSGVRVLQSAVLADHVHILASFRPDGSLSDFVRLAKCGISGVSLNTSAVSTGDTPTGFLAWAVVRLTPGGSPGFIQPKLLDLEPTPGASPGLINTERRLMLLTLPTMLDPRRAL
jgi:hypothetical protein